MRHPTIYDLPPASFRHDRLRCHHWGTLFAVAKSDIEAYRRRRTKKSDQRGVLVSHQAMSDLAIIASTERQKFDIPRGQYSVGSWACIAESTMSTTLVDLEFFGAPTPVGFDVGLADGEECAPVMAAQIDRGGSRRR